MNSYNNAFTEVFEILNCLEENELNKIPEEVLKTIEKNRNIEYEYLVDKNIDLKEQKMLIETKAILFNLFRDYLSTPEQKEKIIRMQQEERIKNEENKKIKFSSNVFSNNVAEDIVIYSGNQNKELVEYKESFIQKVWNNIKIFLKFKK